ncbi:MAG: NAD(P)/FAD-dependent oxidoreductase [Terracidiphilus sp.]|jgi:flavin-dependent dehydrogenase
MTAPPRSVEHLVIGGGPAGAMVALRLAAAGRSVTLLEKEPGPHDKVCGEFLSREAVDYLQQAGISPLDLGATTIGNVRLSAGNKIVEAPLPFHALSLSRRVLDAHLLACAEEKGCRIMRGFSAESLTPESNGWRVTLSNGRFIRASTVFLATGKHDLRGFPRTHARQSNLVGFKMHWQLAPAQVAALRDSMDLYLFTGGYGGLSLIEDSIANLCFVVRRSALRSVGGWPQLLASILRRNRHLHQLLDGATPLWPRPLAISPIPYGYLAGESGGLWCVGDQAAVIPSFTGDGISIALHSAALAAQMFLSGSSAADYTRTLRQQLTHSMTLSTWLSRAAVTHGGRTAALAALTLAPGVMRWVAASTRIPQSSLVPGGASLHGAGPAVRQSA